MILARENLSRIADLQRIKPSDLACTLLFAVIFAGEGLFVQIGDGAWVYRCGDYQCGTFPSNGEFANTTTFLTSEDALNVLQFRKVTAQIDRVAGFTDGIQMLGLKLADNSVHAPFFDFLFEPLSFTDDASSLKAPLLAFLSSDKVNSRTDDDKTLVLALRTQEKC